jgi:hypothetical protein
VQVNKINFAEHKTMQNQTLNRLKAGKIGKREAYRLLYPKPARVRGPKRAHFVKLRIRIPESKGVTAFLAFLFFLPAPLFLAKMIVKRVKFDEGDGQIDKQELMRLIATRGLKVDVKTHDGVSIYIKTL